MNIKSYPPATCQDNVTKCRGVKYDGPERFSHGRCLTGITANSPTRPIPAPGIIWKTWGGDGDGGGVVVSSFLYSSK